MVPSERNPHVPSAPAATAVNAPSSGAHCVALSQQVMVWSVRSPHHFDQGLSNRLCEGVSSYVKLGAVFGGWRWVQMRSEIRRLRTRIASLWVFPRVMSFW